MEKIRDGENEKKQGNATMAKTTGVGRVFSLFNIFVPHAIHVE